MENIDFVIDLKEKNKLSKGGKIFHYCFGSILLVIGVLCHVKSFGHTNNLFTFDSLIIVFGITWIVKGLMGKVYFIAPQKYFMIRDNKIHIKNPNKMVVVYPAEMIENIKISVLKIDIGIKNLVKSYDLKWITHSEFQELKDKVKLFCEYNNIKIE
jgi:hypothetical protein